MRLPNSWAQPFIAVAILALAVMPAQANSIYLPLLFSESPVMATSAGLVKKGVPLSYPYCRDAAALGASWIYDFTARPLSCPGVESVPMLFDGSSIGTVLTDNSRWILGFNEPDLPWVNNMPLATAVTLWHKVEQTYPDRLLVAPAPSHRNPSWIVQFYDAYSAQYGRPPRLDALAAHCYLLTPGDCENLVNQFIGWAHQWGVAGGVWVTEFAYLPCVFSTSTAIDYMQQFTTWLEGNPDVARFSWFTNREDGSEAWSAPVSCLTPLVDMTGRLTQFGTTYAGF